MSSPSSSVSAQPSTRPAKVAVYMATAGLITALSLAIPALVQSCGARITADQGKTRQDSDGMKAMRDHDAFRDRIDAQDRLLAIHGVQLEDLRKQNGLLLEVAKKCLNKAELKRWTMRRQQAQRDQEKDLTMDQPSAEVLE